MTEVIPEGWKRSEFVEKVDERVMEKHNNKKLQVHFNTIDGWFKELEKKGVHYVERENGEKKYDMIDLEIAMFIIEGRKINHHGLVTLTEALKRGARETRAFPTGEEIEKLPKNMQELVMAVRQEVLKDIKDEIKEEARNAFAAERENMFGQLREIQKQELEEEKKKLFAPDKYQKEQEEKTFKLAMEIAQAQSTIEADLREEALVQWNMKPENERFKRSFLTKKEKTDEKFAFIEGYIQDHIEVRMIEWRNTRNSSITPVDVID